MRGDPEAFKKLKLTKEEKDKLKKQNHESPKQKLSKKDILDEIEKAK